MKKIAVLLLSVLLLLISLCGCQDPSGFLSDFGGQIKRTYENISEEISGGISAVVPSGAFASEDVVYIYPNNEVPKNNRLSAYRKLSDKQKKLYSIMLEAVENMELRNIEVTKYVTGDGFSDSIVAHRALLCDRPDIFWMPKTISVLSLEGRKEKYIAFKDYYGEDDQKGFYGLTVAEKEEKEVLFNAALENALKNVGKYSTLFEKELYIHDYICENTVYDEDAANELPGADKDSLSAYGALVNGKAICEGYAKAFELLCIKSGIPCNVVSGIHSDVPHMWNIADLGDGVYYVDPTFDDGSSSSLIHVYFNVTKEFISADRTFDAAFSPESDYGGEADFNFFTDDCEGTASNYYEKLGAYIDADCASAAYIISQAIQNGKNTAEFKNITGMSPQNALEHLAHKVRKTVAIQYCYRYDDENIIIAVW